ncbi:tyrosine-type recombinase/integrase [Kutzneria albida]|uniref:Integrase family protein n=1 Tax=Kutzneria albida DSM 43870 TaxID=1449976 RepID=W5VZA7_9PSEU|nr:site-specific integrase [Kutzneria albida]AHH94248.1 integrase family protein [Kutzneria albida DSM 43870]
MGHIQDRWWRPKKDETGKPVLDARGRAAKEKTDLYGSGDRYKVRYLDPEGREKSKTFPDKAKKAAEDFLISVESDKREGRYVDPKAGEKKFSAYVETWYGGQSPDASTQENLRSQVTSQMVPFFGNLAMKRIDIPKVREWLLWMNERGLSLRYQKLLFDRLSSILNAAVEEKIIHSNPCRARSVQSPSPPERRVTPWPLKRMRSVHLALPARCGVVIPLSAGVGLRQGEIFGLADTDLDRDAQELVVARQVRIVANTLVFAPPKSKKSRTVPLGAGVLDQLDDYIEQFSPVEVTLPWEKPGGKPVTARLILTTPEGGACRRQKFNMGTWRPAFARAGLEYRNQEDGMHALRHLYASTQLENGVSIKALSLNLGHHDPGFTLRVYTHLMPSSHERSRRAADAVFKPKQRPDDDPRPGDGLARSSDPETAGQASTVNQMAM